MVIEQVAVIGLNALENHEENKVAVLQCVCLGRKERMKILAAGTRPETCGRMWRQPRVHASQSVIPTNTVQRPWIDGVASGPALPG